MRLSQHRLQQTAPFTAADYNQYVVFASNVATGNVFDSQGVQRPGLVGSGRRVTGSQTGSSRNTGQKFRPDFGFTFALSYSLRHHGTPNMTVTDFINGALV